MHLWKLLATFAIRYHILDMKNESTYSSSSTDPDVIQLGTMPFLPRTMTSNLLFPKSNLAKMWFRRQATTDNNVTSLSTSLALISKDNENTDKDTSLTTNKTTNDVVNSSSKEATGNEQAILAQELPWEYSYLELAQTNDKDGASLPRLAWLALTTSVFTTIGQPSCARWNCPCAGYPRREQRSIKLRNIPLQKSVRTHSSVAELLRKIEQLRFGNENHVTALQQCSESRNENCISQYLENNCTIDGLPTLQHIESHGKIKQFDDFLHETRKSLASIAMFMETARLEEEHHSASRALSLAQDIRLLEEKGIYHLLCVMDKINSNRHNDILHKDITCRAAVTRSKSDNSSYFVLHAFDKLLQVMINRLQKRN